MNDQQIINLLRQGKHSKALDKLYKSFPSVRKFILTHGGSTDDTKDVFQEALMILCQNALKPEFELTAKISTYLFSVSRYLWKDRLSKLNKQANIEVESLNLIQEDISQFHEKENSQNHLDQILKSIGENCRRILEAYYFHKRTMLEIKRKYGYSTVASAKNQKYKCLEKARKQARDFNSNLQSKA